MAAIASTHNYISQVAAAVCVAGAGVVILYHITGRTPDLQCIFGNHLKPGLSRPGGPIAVSYTHLTLPTNREV